MPVLSDARHELFAQEVARGTRISDAYVKAGYLSEGKGVNANSARLKARPAVKARIEELKHLAAGRCEITIAGVLAELGKIGFSDIRALFNDNGQLRRIEELDDAAAACLSSVELVTRRVPGSDRDDPEYESVSKIRLWDKRAALVDIGKHLGMFVDRHEHTGANGGPIQTEDMTDREAASRMLFVIEKARKEKAATLN